MVRCLWAILPASILWGASLPLALAAVTGGGEDPGRVVGGVYAANTLGAIVGALGVSLILVPWIGTQNSQRLLLIVSALARIAFRSFVDLARWPALGFWSPAVSCS